jgi:hypothetical protein
MGCWGEQGQIERGPDARRPTLGWRCLSSFHYPNPPLSAAMSSAASKDDAITQPPSSVRAGRGGGRREALLGLCCCLEPNATKRGVLVQSRIGSCLLCSREITCEAPTRTLPLRSAWPA